MSSIQGSQIPGIPRCAGRVSHCRPVLAPSVPPASRSVNIRRSSSKQRMCPDASEAVCEKEKGSRQRAKRRTTYKGERARSQVPCVDTYRVEVGRSSSVFRAASSPTLINARILGLRRRSNLYSSRQIPMPCLHNVRDSTIPLSSALHMNGGRSYKPCRTPRPSIRKRRRHRHEQDGQSRHGGIAEQSVCKYQL